MTVGMTPVAGAATGRGRTSDVAELPGVGTIATATGTTTVDEYGAGATTGSTGGAASASAPMNACTS